MAGANRELYRDIGTSGYYCTGILLRFTGYRVEYANANHPPLLRKRATGAGPALPDDESSRGFYIGMVPEHSAYGSSSFSCESGDCLVLYTDGVTEARDRAGNLFGEERLTRVIAAGPGHDAAALLRHITESLSAFTMTPGVADDDITIIVVRRR